MEANKHKPILHITEKEQALVDKWINELKQMGYSYDDMIEVFKLARKKHKQQQNAKS